MDSDEYDDDSYYKNIELINKINNVKNVMHENISSILERQEKLEVLVDKTDDLKEKSYTFHWKSKDVKKKMICNKIKGYIVNFFFISILIWIISVLICGIDYSSCENKKKN